MVWGHCNKILLGEDHNGWISCGNLALRDCDANSSSCAFRMFLAIPELFSFIAVCYPCFVPGFESTKLSFKSAVPILVFNQVNSFHYFRCSCFPLVLFFLANEMGYHIISQNIIYSRE